MTLFPATYQGQSLELEHRVTDGMYCYAAGWTESLPDLFFKLVGPTDASLAYLRAIMSGELHGSLFPEVHAIEPLEDRVMTVVERARLHCEDSGFCDMAQNLDYFLEAPAR